MMSRADASDSVLRGRPPPPRPPARAAAATCASRAGAAVRAARAAVAANAAVCAIVALLALAAACERVSSRASASRLWDAQARERAPDAHAAFVIKDPEFAFAFSRQKPLKLRGELSWWERVR